MKTDHELSGDYGNQTLLPGMGPQVGERYCNIHTDDICTVTYIRRGRRTWVTVRANGHEGEVRITDFMEHYYRL